VESALSRVLWSWQIGRKSLKTFNWPWRNSWLFISGQIGLRAGGSIPDDPKQQIDVAFQRIEAVLKHLGLDFTDVVELVSYHVDVGSQLATFREVKERYIRSDFPAWTILGVASLARPELIVEIKVVAATRK
jgi:enamine deaminase RidA (YjgF/YER057c/UK114 family)